MEKNLFDLVENELELAEGSELDLETLAQTGAIRWTCPNDDEHGEIVTPVAQLLRHCDGDFDLRCPKCAAEANPDDLDEDYYDDYVAASCLEDGIEAVLSALVPMPPEDEPEPEK